jgi:hypothetical protein
MDLVVYEAETGAACSALVLPAAGDGEGERAPSDAPLVEALPRLASRRCSMPWPYRARWCRPTHGPSASDESESAGGADADADCCAAQCEVDTCTDHRSAADLLVPSHNSSLLRTERARAR